MPPTWDELVHEFYTCKLDWKKDREVCVRRAKELHDLGETADGVVLTWEVIGGFFFVSGDTVWRAVKRAQLSENTGAYDTTRAETERKRKSHAKSFLTEGSDDQVADLVEKLEPHAKAKLAKALSAQLPVTAGGIETTPISTDLWDLPTRLRTTAHKHIEHVARVSEFLDAYGSRVHTTSDGEQFTGAELITQVMDQVKAELDLAYSNAIGEGAVDKALSQILS